MTAEEVVDRQLEYYNNNDLDNFCSTYSDDIHIVDHLSGETILHGQDALRKKYKVRFYEQKVNAKIVKRIILGNTVIDHEHVTGIEEDRIVQAVAIYEVENDRIVKVSFVSE